MKRLEIDDLVMSAYINSLKATGQTKQAESVKKIYEIQRVEIMANEGDVNEKNNS